MAQRGAGFVEHLRPWFKFRSKMPGVRWRASWDWALFVGGAVPSLVFGLPWETSSRRSVQLQFGASRDSHLPLRYGR